ncbi:hypothetical protein F53441_8624 [Fusarium austroafricanum]|uniref:BTB domain-containing protein n=1 Tax=Fusarium austroafricanum TaxID=2364996 RepID=A0A8H4KDP2_9HYPO|nr:hypothetical protein F53441_8624 [Fusarium austroafricanum]
MVSVLYEVDSGGDVEIVLKNPDTKNIVPKIALKPCPKLFPKDIPPEKNGDLTQTVPDDETSYPEEDAQLVQYFASYSAIPRPQPLVGERYGSILTDLDNSLFRKENPEKLNKNVEIRMRVSSKHISLASPVLAKELQHTPSAQSTPRTARSIRREIQVNRWDAKAMATVLNIIHGRHAQVPRKITVEFMANVVAFAKYYECLEAVEMSAELWHSINFREGKGLSSDALMWLYISWVFSWEKPFNLMIHRVLPRFQGSFQLNDLPANDLLKKADKLRQEYIKKYLAGLQQLQDTMCLEEGCPKQGSSECSTLAVGSLSRGKIRLTKLNPPFVSPYTGYSIEDVYKLVKEFPEEESFHRAYGVTGMKCLGHMKSYSLCTIHARMKETRESINKEIEKIDLRSF